MTKEVTVTFTRVQAFHLLDLLEISAQELEDMGNIEPDDEYSRSIIECHCSVDQAFHGTTIKLTPREYQLLMDMYNIGFDGFEPEIEGDDVAVDNLHVKLLEAGPT